MSKQETIRAAAKPLTAAVLLALATPAAFAAVSPTQLPGVGYANSTSVTSAVTASTNTLTITNSATAPVVIQWGGSKPSYATGSTINSGGSAGFNIGQSATVVFSAKASQPVLNIDATGNPSQILGNLQVSGADSASMPLYVANANGIVVGSGAVISAAGGLGLINANMNNTAALNLFESSGTVGIDFTGATGGITISQGANLNQVTTGLLIAGAGNVNVAGAFVSQSSTTVYSINDTTPTTIDAGVGGYGTVGVFTATDSSGTGIKAFLSQSSSSITPGTIEFSDAPNSAVTLNLGTAQSPYAATGTGNLSVYAAGDVNVAAGSNLSSVQPDTFQWTGTFTNAGTLNYGTQTSSSIPTTTAFGALGYAGGKEFGNTSQIYLNTSMSAPAGAFVNASTGLINAGDFIFSGASFSNAGTIQMGQATTDGTPTLSITAYKGGIDLGGTVSVVSAGIYTGSVYLNTAYFGADYTAGQSVNIATALPTVSSSVMIGATNVNVADSITVTNGNFVFYPFGQSVAGAAAVSGAFTLASGATITALNAYFGSTSAINGYYGEAASSPADTSYSIAGNIVANDKATPAVVSFGADNNYVNSPGYDDAANVFNVTGAGSITAGKLIFKNLKGSVNNITSGQILANGFQLNAPSGGSMAIEVNANGGTSQGFNVKVNGNASIDSGTTLAVKTQKPANNNTYGQYLIPANANSNLVVQASGSLTVNAGSVPTELGYGNGTLPGSFFQWPGLVYLQANGGQLTANASIANAYAAQATAGRAGVFLVAKNITDNYPIYTNGNAGVVFAAPYDATTNTYAYASSINGIDPSKANPGLPTVYFATPNPTVANANFSFQVLNTFVNEYGYNQENQTFLTYSPAK